MDTHLMTLNAGLATRAPRRRRSSLRALERLKQDHAALRVELAVLQYALQVGEQTQVAFQGASRALWHSLRSHIRREERLTAQYSRQLECVGPTELGGLAIDHDAERRRLQLLQRCLSTSGGRLTPTVSSLVPELLDECRRHMAEQETRLFPLMAQVLTEDAWSVDIGTPRTGGAACQLRSLHTNH